MTPLDLHPDEVQVLKTMQQDPQRWWNATAATGVPAAPTLAQACGYTGWRVGMIYVPLAGLEDRGWIEVRTAPLSVGTPQGPQRPDDRPLHQYRLTHAGCQHGVPPPLPGWLERLKRALWTPTAHPPGVQPSDNP